MIIMGGGYIKKRKAIISLKFNSQLDVRMLFIYIFKKLIIVRSASKYVSLMYLRYKTGPKSEGYSSRYLFSGYINAGKYFIAIILKSGNFREKTRRVLDSVLIGFECLQNWNNKLSEFVVVRTYN